MIKKSKLKSGLKLVFAPTKNKAATILVMAKVGSKYETDNIAGLSHFLEHIFFKGTEKRPNTKAISEFIDEVGGEYNAFTSKEFTGFYAKVAKAHIERAFDFISDILLNSKFDKNDIEREKGVIIEEMNMRYDMPMMYISELFEELLYKNQPAGRLIVGTKDAVLKATRAKFVKYYKDHYVASNMMVCIAGDLNEAEVKALTKKYFSGIVSGTAKRKKKVIERQSKPELYLKYKKTDQTHFCLGVRAYSASNPKRYALSLLSIILGESMSSRLFLSVRERLGLAYYVRSAIDYYTDSGYFVIQAGVDNKREDMAIKVCMGELKKIKEEKIGSQELKKAKEYFKGKMLIGLETSDEMTSYIMRQEVLTGKIKEIKEVIEKIEKVTAEDIQKVAKEIFVNKGLNLAIIGPHKNKNKYLKILKV